MPELFLLAKIRLELFISNFCFMRENKMALKSFEDLYHLHKVAVYQNIQKIVADEDHSLDILQDVFLGLWNNWDKFEDQEPVANWLFVVSYRKSISFLRQRLKEGVLVTDDLEEILGEEWSTQESESFYFQRKLKVLEEAVEVLPPRKKEIFQLYRLEGLSKEEIAKHSNISVETVKDYLKQSNQIIRKYVSIHYPSMLYLVFLLPL